MDLMIRAFKVSDVPGVKELTDQEIGQDYYGFDELIAIQKRSVKNGVNCSFVLLEGDKVRAIRLTFPPGCWFKGKGQQLSEDLWPHELKDTAYFQSLFVHKDYQGQGWGKKLSLASMAELRKLGTKGIVCHSWKESPSNSSSLYLKSMGFKFIKEYPRYWYDVDYRCPRCGKPCSCTAQEMHLDLNLQARGN